jgi:hypothetical protein
MGFRQNPFESYVAENEPDIEQYFAKPPYYNEILARGKTATSFILFGSRGSGKSASRIAFYKTCWKRRIEGNKAPLALVLDDYTRILSSGLSKVDLGSFVEEVAYLTIEGILVWLAALEDDDRKLHLGGLNNEEEVLIIELLKRFYLVRPALARSTSAKQALRLFNQAWHVQAGLWIEKKWDSLAAVVANVSNIIASKAISSESSLDLGLRDLMRLSKQELNNSEYARALLSKLVDAARIFSFDGITVLLDKIDETQETNSSAEASAKILYPLMSTTQLLEVEGFGWLVYLWDKVKDVYGPGQLGVRLDKIANATISWPDDFLAEMVDKRLAYYSNGTIASFSMLCTDHLNKTNPLASMKKLSMNSPRELIRVLDTVFREHEESEDQGLLTQASVDNALDKYVVERLPTLYSKQILQQVSRIKSLQFTNSDLQTIFKTGAQNIRNRINKWQDCGIVGLAGSRPAQGGQGGKDAYLYTVIDGRVQRLLSRSLLLGPEYELEDDPEDFASP